MKGQGQERRPGRALISAEEAAGHLGDKESTIWRWCHEGSIPCLKIGRLWRVRRAELENFAEEVADFQKVSPPGRRTSENPLKPKFVKRAAPGKWSAAGGSVPEAAPSRSDRACPQGGVIPSQGIIRSLCTLVP